MPSSWAATRIAAGIGAAIIALAVAAGLFAWSGLYSVAASTGHWTVVKRFLDFGMRSSVRTHAMGIDVPELGDPDLVRLGAGHFHSGCAFCHGAPGMPISPIAERMLPPPPSLSLAVGEWKPNELFWIVKNGIKYTGMPGWAAPERDDEVWAVVAFLLELPRLDAEGYHGLAFDRVNVAASTGPELAKTESSPQATGACARCHGSGEVGPASGLVPVLHGQSAEYLSTVLRAYADGRRPSGIMQPVATDLDDASIRRLAEYYSGLPPPRSRSAPPPPDAAAVARGRALATEGDQANGIPACTACHAGTALATFPQLAGQHGAYMIRQLELWRSGLNATTERAAIMAPIARRMSPQQIQDASAYYASQSPSRALGNTGK